MRIASFRAATAIAACASFVACTHAPEVGVADVLAASPRAGGASEPVLGFTKDARVVDASTGETVSLAQLDTFTKVSTHERRFTPAKYRVTVSSSGTVAWFEETERSTEPHCEAGVMVREPAAERWKISHCELRAPSSTPSLPNANAMVDAPKPAPAAPSPGARSLLRRASTTTAR